MLQDDTIKLKFDNSYNGRLFAVQGDTGRTYNLQILSDLNNVLDVSGMKLRLYIGTDKEVSYADGEVTSPEEGKFKVQVYNSQLKYAGLQKAQFVLTDKDGQKVGSKVFDLYVEEGLETGQTLGKNILVDFETIDEALKLVKNYDKTLEEAKEADLKLKVDIQEGTETRQALAECKRKAIEIKGQLDTSKTDAGNTLQDLKTTKAESETLKTNLSSENTKASDNIKALGEKTEAGSKTISDLGQSTSTAKATKESLDTSNTTALSTKKSLEETTSTANSTKTSLETLNNQGDTLFRDLSSKITAGDSLKTGLDKSISTASTSKSNLDASIDKAARTDATLKSTDTEAKGTEQLLRDLLGQIGATEEEAQRIIASGDLSKYITDPKLQDILLEYVKREELEDYVKESEAKTLIKKFVKEEAIKPLVMTAVIDQSNSNPLTCVTYEDDAKMMEKGSPEWDDFFGTKLVLFKDGKEVRELKDSELNGLKPEDGDVMVKFKRMGLNIKTVGDKVYVSMTDNPNDESFKYYAHTRGAERKEAFYLGAYLGYEENGKLRSIKDVMPTGSKTIGDFRTLAQANGKGYEQFAFYQLVFLQAMYVLKYGNLDSQTAIGKGLTDGNFAKTGKTNGKGIDFGSTDATLQMRFQYLEDFYGNNHQWIDGVQSGGSSNMMTTTDKFNDERKDYASHPLGFSENIYQYPKKVQGTSELGFIIKENGASQTTHFCDFQHVRGNDKKLPYFGGSNSSGASSGVFYFLCYYSASSSYWYAGSRLMFL